MRLALEQISINTLGDGDLTDRVEKFDRQVEFLGEKFERVGKVGAPPGKKHFFRRIPAVLAAVVIGRTGDFRRKAGQRVSNHHRERGERFVHRLGVASAQGNEPVGDLLVLCVRE